MQKSLLTLKPRYINALFPLFLKNLFFSFIIAIILYGIYFVLDMVNVIDFTRSSVMTLFIVFIVVFSILPLLIRFIILYNTRYDFFKSHIVTEFKFFVIKKHSVLYSQIVNIKVDISIWDRICKAGDIILYTAEDKSPNVVLQYIKNPQQVERAIYKLIHVNKIRS